MVLLDHMRKIALSSIFFCCFAGMISGFHQIELKSGAALRGEVILERSDEFFVDLGYDVLEVPKIAIESIKVINSSSAELSEGVHTDILYTVSATRSDQPVRAWVEQLGEAVGLIQTPTGLGSGFVINDKGYIVTNDHVIAGEHRISVTIFKQGERELSKVTYDNVRIVATSSDLDLALLKIEAEEETEPFDFVSLAAADGGLSEGQTVFAIGSPLGLDRSVSQGIISVAKRVINGRLYLQTTAQINPGNSGGPLFNLRGEVVGVNNMKIAAVGAEGLGFSISSRVLKSFLDNRDAYAFDTRNPNSGFRYLEPPKIADE